ncbi:hypothetical protein BJ742DRAFT_652691, partial [Cladochytrium replicatum]
STARCRQELWTYWRNGKLAGCFARDFDEAILRLEPSLQKYWTYRDIGDLKSAQRELTDNKVTLDVVMIVADRPTTRSHLHIRVSDLYSLGCGGDANEVSSQMFSHLDKRAEVNELLHVLNLDSGTWPTGGGGVGSCRRDLIDHLQNVRWTAIAEIGGSELVQKDYQIERNVDSIIYVPLWDVDFGSPSENVYKTEPYMHLHMKVIKTSKRVISLKFSKILVDLIKGILCTNLNHDSIAQYTNTFVSLYLYFQEYDWVRTWNHPITHETWMKTWLHEINIQYKNEQLLGIETPTLQELDMLYSLLTRLLLILTIKVPDMCVIHSSHHGVQAILGVIAKNLFNSNFTIWDHGILWRERLFGLSEQDGMPRFVQLGFVGLTRLVSRLAYAWADNITPCTSIQNMAWERWLGGEKYMSSYEGILVERKISPVLNGMDVSKFSIKPELEAKEPCAIMLSHISPVKDVANAIKAAHYIVNVFGVTKYQLHIYGSLEKDAAYTNECINLIAALNLTEHVFLKGLGNPANVLGTGWIFVNSSITEGLPLALGEAGLCGLPVVCTDVGGSREVISDFKSGLCYGAIVPPQKPRQLAIGQLKVLSMADGLEKILDPDASDVSIETLLSPSSPEYNQRIYEWITSDRVKECRRRLGLKFRERIINIFSIRRYWREHEQILWSGKA